jgi:hypothetical protein
MSGTKLDNAAIIDTKQNRVLVVNYKGLWILPGGHSRILNGLDGLMKKVNEDLPGVKISPLHLPDRPIEVKMIKRGSKIEDRIYVFRLIDPPQQYGSQDRVEGIQLARGDEETYNFTPLMRMIFSRLKEEGYI